MYQKPEIIVCTPATAAVQGGHKGMVGNPDSATTYTVGAYEADE
jgi:hypothetical protein